MKSPLLRGFDAPDVHLRLRKRLSRCTLDCGFQTSESPALRGFEGERGRFATTSLYLAFFFVLEKGSKSAGNAVIPTFPTRWSHGLQHLRHKRPTLAFTGESGHTHSPSPTGSHTAAHTPKQGPSGRGRYHYPRHVLHVHKHPRAGYQNGVLCRFWVLAGCAPEERRKPSGQRCAYARRCPEASRPRWAAQTDTAR